MKKYKLNIDRQMPSDADIEKHKDFARLLAQMPKTAPTTDVPKPSFVRQYGIYIGIAAVALVSIALWLSQSKENIAENVSTFAEDTITQLKENTLTTPVLPEVSKEVKPSDNKAILSPQILTQKEKEVVKEKETPKLIEKTIENPPKEESIKTESPALILPQKPQGRTLAFKTDVSRFPELSIYQGIQWEYVGNSDQDNPYKNEVLNVKNTWKSVEIQKRDDKTYLLILKDKEGKSFSFPARPVFKDKDYEEAMKIYQEKMTR